MPDKDQGNIWPSPLYKIGKTDKQSAQSLMKLIPILLFLSLLCGCVQNAHVIPPAPRFFSEEWEYTGVAGISISPRADRVAWAPQLGLWYGDLDNAFGISFNGFFWPSTLSYTRYDYLSDEYYLTYQFHLSQFPWLDEGGYTPGIEAGIGIHAKHGFYHHGLKAGIAWMPDLNGNWFNRWNFFSSSPRSTFLPVLGYDAFAGPVALSALWYPGMTRYLLESYTKPQNAGDSGLYYESPDLTVQHFFPPPDSGYLDVVRTGISPSSKLRISKRRNLGHDGTPIRLIRTRELLEHYSPGGYDYYWVMVDEGENYDANLYSRIMALDTAAIAQRYRHTGRLILRDNPYALHRLDTLRIPVHHDMIFNGSIRWHEEEGTED